MDHLIHWQELLPPGVSAALLHTVIVWLLLFLLLTLAVRGRGMVPHRLQNIVEALIDIEQHFSRQFLGDQHRKYDPLFLGIFFFIFLSNLWGLIPGMVAPTASLNTNLGIALIVFLSTHVVGIREHGLGAYLEHFAGNVPLPLKPFMFCLEIISHLVRPISLTLRLFGNIVAKETLLLVLVSLVVDFARSDDALGRFLTLFPVLLYPLLVVLALLVSFIQAFIFMLLAQMYVGGALKSQQPHDNRHHKNERAAQPVPEEI